MSEEDTSNLFGGSIDRSKLEEMKAAAGDDPERQRQVAEVQAQVDAVAESDAAAEQARQEAVEAQAPQPEQGEQPDTTEVTETATAEATETVPSTGEPTRYASKGEWVEYAVSQGAAREDAEANTKDGLIEAYGTK